MRVIFWRNVDVNNLFATVLFNSEKNENVTNRMTNFRRFFLNFHNRVFKQIIINYLDKLQSLHYGSLNQNIQCASVSVSVPCTWHDGGLSQVGFKLQ